MAFSLDNEKLPPDGCQSNEEDEEDVFSDAVEDLAVTSDRLSEESIQSHLSEVYEGLHRFLNNQFHEAEELFKQKSDRSMYHSLGYAAVLTYQAAMTFQSADIELALKSQKKCLSICDRFRRKHSFFDSLHRSKNSYSHMTPEECHAELCYAESLLQQAFLTFIQDENFVSFIKGALRIKTCLNSYRASMEIMKKRKWKDGDEKEHFQSGICAGVGAFNLMISLLPPKILKVLEFVGYKGCKMKGLKELEIGASLTGSLRAPMCSVLLIMYHTIISFIFGIGDGDIDLSQKLLEGLLDKCPKSAILLCLHGRILEVSGSIDEAILKFEQSISSQSHWKQFHHFCFWELMWCHGLTGNWLLSMKYAERLLSESNWSKAIYAYQKAVFMMMCFHDDDQENDAGDIVVEPCDKEMKAHINALFNEVPKLKQRIAGKSVPIEKFAVKKVEMYWEQQQYLTLPSYELLYLWNGYEILARRHDLLHPVYLRIRKARQKFKDKGSDQLYQHDNYGLLNLLEGVCLRHLGQKQEAFTCFREIVSSEKNIKRDAYLVPASYFEMGMLNLVDGRRDEAKRLLEIAKSYSGYQVESRITSKIQAALLKIKFETGKLDEVDVVEDLSRIQLEENVNAAVS